MRRRQVIAALRLSVLATIVISAAAAVACLRWAAPPRVFSEAECGRVDIVSTRQVVGTLSEVQARIVLQSGRVCVPRLDYSSDVAEAWPVFVMPADEHVNGRASLSEPLMFQDVTSRVRKGDYFLSLDFRDVRSGGPIVFKVPAGDYRLVLRYQTGHCAGKWFDTTCLSVSEPFRISSDREFTIEKSSAITPRERNGD